MNVSVWLSAYDIADVRTLTCVAKLLSKYMSRLQKSIFVGLLSDEMASALYSKVSSLLGNQDKFILVHLCKSDVKKISFFKKSKDFEALMSDYLVL